MKKISEVCKIVGVTRRTLQEYDKVGLLHPTGKTEGGYWLYDDASISKLIQIQVFIEAGYERKDVKHLLETPTFDIIDDLDQIISTLEEKRRRIDGMIDTLKMLKTMSLFPKKTFNSFANIDIASLYKSKSFLTYWNEFIDLRTTDPDDDTNYLELFGLLLTIGLSHDKPIDDPDVIESAKLFCDSYMNMILSDFELDNTTGNILTLPFAAKLISEGIEEFLSDPNITKCLEMQCGENSTTYILDVIKYYCSSLQEVDIKKWRNIIDAKKDIG